MARARSDSHASLALRIRERREELGFTQLELARLMGVSAASSVIRAERGGNIQLSQLYSIARALKLEAWELLVPGAAAERRGRGRPRIADRVRDARSFLIVEKDAGRLQRLGDFAHGDRPVVVVRSADAARRVLTTDVWAGFILGKEGMKLEDDLMQSHEAALTLRLTSPAEDAAKVAAFREHTNQWESVLSTLEGLARSGALSSCASDLCARIAGGRRGAPISPRVAYVISDAPGPAVDGGALVNDVRSLAPNPPGAKGSAKLQRLPSGVRKRIARPKKRRGDR